MVTDICESLPLLQMSVSILFFPAPLRHRDTLPETHAPDTPPEPTTMGGDLATGSFRSSCFFRGRGP
eukprot:g6385.t1